MANLEHIIATLQKNIIERCEVYVPVEQQEAFERQVDLTLQDQINLAI